MEDRGLPTCRCGRVDWFNDGLVVTLDRWQRVTVERVLDPDPYLLPHAWSCAACGSEVVHGSTLDRRLDRLSGTERLARVG